MKRIAALLGLICIIIGASAQNVLTLQECREMALRDNSSLAASRAVVLQKSAEHDAATTNALPKVTLTATYMRLGREISILSDGQKAALNHLGDNLLTSLQQRMPNLMAAAQDILQRFPELSGLLTAVQGKAQNFADALNSAGQGVVDAFSTDNRNMGGAAILLTQPIYMGGKIRAYNRLTDYSARLAAEQLRAAEEDVLLDVETAYWQVVSLCAKKKLAEDYLAMLRHLEHDVELMVENEVATRATLLTVSVKVDEAEMTLLKVEDGLTLSRMLLCQLCGLPLDTPVRLADEDLDNVSIAEQPLEGDTTLAYANRPELRQLEMATYIYKEKERIVAADFRPNIALVAGAAFATPSLYNGFENRLRGNWAVGVTFSMPLWNWHEGRYKRKAARAEGLVTSLRLDDAREKIALQVRQCRFRVTEARRRVQLSLHNLERADENLRIADLGHREQVIATSDVLQAHTAWLQAHSEKIDSQVEVRLAQTALRKALGMLD
ncbi:MAG: TolC family protein [Bacteroidaceae bacterium]|nr:TolC family protein [Bacteroidaceae bacterium]